MNWFEAKENIVIKKCVRMVHYIKTNKFALYVTFFFCFDICLWFHLQNYFCHTKGLKCKLVVTTRLQG